MTESFKIDKSDLEPILLDHRGSRSFLDALGCTEQSKDLVQLLSHFIHFNSVFGSGVANLAGEIGSRQDLFKDPDEPISIIADRSVDVAAEIFYAAIEEFGNSNRVQRCSHRKLAQALLMATGGFFNFDPVELNRISQPDVQTLAAFQQVRDGYRINRTIDEPEIFRAIGFHIASEVLADQEFNDLDKFLRERFSDLVVFLSSAKVSAESKSTAYSWIQIHTTVEQEHFDAAVKSANLALRFYAGARTKMRIKEWILDGFREFSQVQSDFMRSLMP